MKRRRRTNESTLLEAKKDLEERRRLLRKVNVEKLKKFLQEFAQKSNSKRSGKEKRFMESVLYHVKDHVFI